MNFTLQSTKEQNSIVVIYVSQHLNLIMEKQSEDRRKKVWFAQVLVYENLEELILEEKG